MHEDVHDERQFLSSADVAKLIDRTPAAVRAAVRAGRLPVAATTAGGIQLFTRDVIEQFLAQRQRGEQR